MAEEPDFSNFEGEVEYVSEDLKKTLTEAMIDAYMRSAPYVVDGSCSEGRFEYIQPPNRYGAPSYRFYVSYPGGEWTSDGGLIGGDQPADFTPFDAAGAYQAIETEVERVLPSMMRAPRPGDFTDQIAMMQYVVKHLSVSGEVRNQGTGQSTTVEVGNELVPYYIDVIRNELSDLNGTAIVRLRTLYGGERIDDVMTGVHALAVVAGVLVAGEQQTWARFHRDFHKLVEAAAADFHAFSEGNEVSAGEIFDVVLSVADASGLLSIPAGPAGVIGKAKTLAGIVKGWLPDTPEPHDYSLDGSSFDALWSSFWQAVSDLIADVESTELAFNDCAVNAAEAASNKQGEIATSFDLKNPTEFLNAGERGIYYDELGQRDDDIVINSALQRVAGNYEALGDHCRQVGGKLLSAPDRGPWSRDFAGSSGLFHGHFDSFNGLVQGIAELLKGNADEMHSVGEKCLQVLADFNFTDRAIETELDRLATAVVDQAKEDTNP